MHKLLATRGLVTYIKVAPRCRKKVQRREMKTRMKCGLAAGLPRLVTDTKDTKVFNTDGDSGRSK